MTEKVVRVVLQLDGKQYAAELKTAEQQHQAWSGSVTTAADRAGTALKGVDERMGAVSKGARAMGSAVESAGAQILSTLRDQIATTGKSTEELLRYRAAQAGVGAQAAPLILQLQNQRAAQQAAAEAARLEEIAQRTASAQKQQAAAAQQSFLAGLRDQAALQGKSATEALRYRAAQLGVADGAETYIRALEDSNKAHGRGAISAGQHAAAMRMLPAQMTDIVTSMASGMPIWMVAIQQGGQIKDSFGGAGNALRAMTGAITPAAAGFGLLAGTVGVAALAYYKGSAEADAYRHGIVMSGNAAGTTVGQLTDMARAIAEVTGTQGAAAAALAQMAGSGDIAAENLQHFSAVAMDLDRYVGVPVKNVVADLESLAKAPLAASLKLNEQYHYLTEAVYSHIKALDEQGKKEEAGAAAQRAYISAFEARKNEIVANLGSIERAWHSVTDVAKKGWDAILGIGRATTDEQNLSQLRENLARRQERPGYKEGQATADLKEEIRLLERKIAMNNANAAAIAGQAKQTEAVAEWDKIVAANLSKQAKEAKEVENIRQKGLAAGKNEAAIQQEIAAYKAKNADKGAANSVTRELERQRSLLAELAGLSNSFYRDWEDLNKQFKNSKLTAEQLTQEQEKLLAKQPGIKAAREAELKVMQAQYAVQQQIADEIAQAEVARTQAVYAGRQAVTDYARGVSESTRLLEVERQTVTGTASQRGLAVEYLRIELELERQLEAIRTNTGFTQDDRDEQADKARATAAQARANATARAEIEHVRELRTELQRVTEQYEQGLVNSAIQGGKSLREYVTGMLRATAFRIVLQPIMAPLAGLVAGVAGSASGTAGSSGVGTLGSVAGLANMFGAGGLGGSLAAGAGWLTGATSFGGAIGAGASLIGTGSAAGVMSGLGMIAGALGPIAIGLSLLSSVIKKSTPHMGALAQYSAAGGLSTSYEHGAYGMGFGGVAVNDETRKAVGTVAQTMVTTLDGISKRFGGKGGYEVATAFADDSSKDGAWGGLRISVGGKDLINWNEDRDGRWAPREFADGDAGRKQYEAELAKSLRSAVSEMPIAKWAKDQLDALGEDVSLDSLSAVVDSINAAADAFDNLRAHVQSFAALSEEALSAMVAAAGSPQALASGMSSFLGNYYSEEERATVVRRQIQDHLTGLGMDMPGTREGMRALVDAALAGVESATGDARTEAARTAAELLGLSESFASVTQATQGLTAAQEEARRSITDKAFSALQAAVQRERDIAQTALDAAEDRASAGRTLVESLQAETDALRGAVSSTSGLAAARGAQIIDQAVASVRAGMAPQGLGTDLTAAAAAARGGIMESGFKSRKDYEEAQLVLANKLEAIHGRAAQQLTADEMLVANTQATIDGLDKLLKSHKEALDIARGTNTAVIDVATAVREFKAALLKEDQKPENAQGTASGFVIGGGGGGGGGGGMSPGDQAELRAQSIRDYVGMVYKDSTNYADKNALSQISANAYLGNWSLSEMASALKVPAEDIVNLMEGAGFTHWRNQLPGFANGGNHRGGMRMVGEEGPEVEFTGPSLIYSAQQTRQLLAGLNSGGASEPSGGSAIARLAQQQYELLRAVITRLDTLQTLARKNEALGVKQRPAIA